MLVRAAILLTACLPGLLAACQGAPDGGLAGAMRNYPPLILGANTRPTDGTGPYARPCPEGGRVEQRGGRATEYLGADPASPELCRMRLDGVEATGWYGIWLTTWPGADAAHAAFNRLVHGRTGDVEAFDVTMGPDLAFHDIMRNEGIEAITLRGRMYRALKLSHYREGGRGNTYRSVSTGWKDMDTGMILYATYQHISGAPEIDVPILPTAIIPAR